MKGLKHYSKGAMSAFCLTFYKQKINKNGMLRHFVGSIDKSYQWYFPKIVVLKHFMKKKQCAAPSVEHFVNNIQSAKIWKKCSG